MKELVSKNILDFQTIPTEFEGYQISFSIVGEYESMFPIVGFIVHQMLSIMGCQVEMGRIFSLINILNNLKRCHLQINNFKTLMLVNKN
jgi:hypothetical protein